MADKFGKHHDHFHHTYSAFFFLRITTAHHLHNTLLYTPLAGKVDVANTVTTTPPLFYSKVTQPPQLRLCVWCGIVLFLLLVSSSRLVVVMQHHNNQIHFSYYRGVTSPTSSTHHQISVWHSQQQHAMQATRGKHC